MSKDKWNDDRIQFMRLLSEIQASKLTTEQYKDLSESMDLSFDSIDELLQRATDAWDTYLLDENLKKQAGQQKPSCGCACHDPTKTGRCRCSCI